jgi:hypothetical protein
MIKRGDRRSGPLLPRENRGRDTADTVCEGRATGGCRSGAAWRVLQPEGEEARAMVQVQRRQEVSGVGGGGRLRYAR